LPANSECKFGYYKSWEVAISDIIFISLTTVSVLGSFYLAFYKKQ